MIGEAEQAVGAAAAIERILAGRGRLLGAGDGVPPPAASPGDHVLNPDLPVGGGRTVFTEAAVLIGITAAATLLLTERTAGLRTHSGEVALPGGRIDDVDDGPVGAALREAAEEIGLDPARVAPLGRMAPYVTHHGYRIHPVVALVGDGPALKANPDEVAAIFEVPLAQVLDAGAFVLDTRMWNGRQRRFWTLPHATRRIWGITAGILHAFSSEFGGAGR